MFYYLSFIESEKSAYRQKLNAQKPVQLIENSFVKSTTRESYESEVENHIKRVFPTQMLSEISTKSIQMFILSLQQGVGIPLNCRLCACLFQKIRIFS